MLTVLLYSYASDQASMIAYNSVMQEIQGGCACRLPAAGGAPPVLLVLAPSNVAAIRAACLRPGGADMLLSARVTTQPAQTIHGRRSAAPRKEPTA